MADNPFVNFFQSLMNPSIRGELAEQVFPWLQKFAVNVPKKAAIAAQDPCEHVSRRDNDCEAMGVLVCKTCGSLVCLSHAYVSADAQVICTACVGDFTRMAREEDRREEKERGKGKGKGKGNRRERDASSKQHRWQRPGPGRQAPPAEPTDEQDRIAALQTLGLPPTATITDVHLRFRKISREKHPDLFTDPQQKLKAEVEFKKISAAYSLLMAWENDHAA